MMRFGRRVKLKGVTEESLMDKEMLKKKSRKKIKLSIMLQSERYELLDLCSISMITSPEIKTQVKKKMMR